MKKLKKFFNQRGQTAVFFALLLPAIILFLFVVFDLGWLYLNKSRLQNAAEAAAIAGANKFCEVSDSGYNDVLLIYEKDDKYTTLRDNEKNFPDSDDKVRDAKVAAKTAAESSWSENLGGSADAAEDSWTKVAVSPDYKLYGETDDAETIYYEVELKEDVTHIFKVLENVFSTEIPAVAVVEISKKVTLAEEPLLPQIEALAETQTIGNWEEQNVAYGQFKNATAEKLKEGIYFDSKAEHRNRLYYDGKWNHFQDPDAKIHYKTGDNYKTENVTVSSDSTSLKTTSANGNNIFNDNELDSLNIDFKQDVSLTIGDVLNDDWDIGFDINGTGIAKVDVAAYRDNWNVSQMDLRIHVTINFDRNYPTRTLSDTEKDKVNARYQKSGVAESADSDPLYVRIESEPMVANLYGKTMTTLNSVRQIILNINETNIDAGDDEHTHTYTYRPLVIFYNGPEKNDEDSARVSQPVIVNLKADFRGILFMPNSPVVINGNGHKFQGFVIAKEFKKLKTENDYAKLTLEAGNKEVYIEKVTTYTEPVGNDEVMVKKTGTDYWFKVKKSALYYADEYKRIIVNDELLGDTHYIAKKPTEFDTINKLELSNYDTTTYYRQKSPSDKRTPAYVKKGLILGKVVNGEIVANDANVNANDVNIIKGTKSGWYEVKNQNGEIYAVLPVDDNIHYYQKNINYNGKDLGDYRIITDEDNKQYLVPNKTITENNAFVKITDYMEVVDAEGKKAYVQDFDYFAKKSDAEPLILDMHGNVQYTEKLSSDYTLANTLKLDAKGKTPCFYPSTFGLSTNGADTHYSRCGAVTKRGRYTALDAFERKNKSGSYGDYSQDMFFETERAKYII